MPRRPGLPRWLSRERLFVLLELEPQAHDKIIGIRLEQHRMGLSDAWRIADDAAAIECLLLHHFVDELPLVRV